MSRERLVKITIWLIVVLLIAIAIVWLWIVSAIGASGNRTSQVRFIIKEGSSVNDIGLALKNNGIIYSEQLFGMGVLLEGASGSLQAGEYLIPANASIKNMITLFSTGETEDEVSITILEGWSNQEIASYLDEEGIVTEQDFLDAANVTDSREILPNVSFPVLSGKPDTQGLEGFLYPDTYRIFENANASDIIFKMLTNFEQKLSEEDRQQIEAQGKTPYDVLTLASIVEREESKLDDMKIVAGIFWKRLEIGMALQSDATINYVTDGGRRQPTLEDLETESPYNTYLYRGLPPGPIGNPSIAAIRATINYEESDYLYFLHPLSGETIYSKTLNEHSRNKQIYLD